MATKISSGSKFSALGRFSKLLRPLSARAAASKMAEAVSVLKLGRINRKRKKAERVREFMQAKYHSVSRMSRNETSSLKREKPSVKKKTAPKKATTKKSVAKKK